MISILATQKEGKNSFRYFVINPDGLRIPFKTDKVSKAFMTSGHFRVTRTGLTGINNPKIKL